MLASRGFLAVLSLLYLGIAARTLGLVGFGRFSLITGASQALATLVAFQCWQMIVQFGVGVADDCDEGRIARLFKGSAVLDVASAIFGAVLAVIILELYSDVLGIGPTLKRATLAYAVIQVVTIRSTALGILRLRDQFSLAAIADGVMPVVRLIGAAVAMIVHPTVQAFLGVWAAAEILTAATYWGMIAWTGDLNLIWRGGNISGVIAENPGIIRFAFSTNANITLGLATKQIPLLLVGSEVGLAAAGTFRLAAQLAQALGKFGQLLSRAAFPDIVRAVRNAEIQAVRQMLFQSMLAGGIVGAFVMALAAFIGRSTLKLIGGGAFGHGSTVLLWMAAAGAVDLIAVGLDTVMTARGHAGQVLIIRLVGVAAMLAVAAVAVPLVGVSGMAIAVLAGSVAVTSMLTTASFLGNRR